MFRGSTAQGLPETFVGRVEAAERRLGAGQDDRAVDVAAEAPGAAPRASAIARG